MTQETVMVRLRREDWVQFRKIASDNSTSACAVFGALVDILQQDDTLREKTLRMAAEARLPWGGPKPRREAE